MKKGFEYDIEDRILKMYISLTPIQKLEWLESVRRFISSTLPEKTRKILFKVKKGEI
ncbi:hypothetical protein KAW48_10175 [candidate division WOR-3 bacterium]|nr:hypothetical protein [candidate division WOR-3 bacterium]